MITEITDKNEDFDMINFDDFIKSDETLEKDSKNKLEHYITDILKKAQLAKDIAHVLAEREKKLQQVDECPPIQIIQTDTTNETTFEADIETKIESDIKTDIVTEDDHHEKKCCPEKTTITHSTFPKFEDEHGKGRKWKEYFADIVPKDIWHISSEFIVSFSVLSVISYVTMKMVE